MMERTSTPASMATRRQFLAAGLAAPVAYAGLRSAEPAENKLGHSDPVNSTPEQSCQNDNFAKPSGRARVAIISGIGDWWRPRNWRSVPDHGAIIELSDLTSFREARQRVKSFNRYPQLSPGMWAIVIATDARRERKAGDRKSGEAPERKPAPTPLYMLVIDSPEGTSEITLVALRKSPIEDMVHYFNTIVARNGETGRLVCQMAVLSAKGAAV